MFRDQVRRAVCALVVVAAFPSAAHAARPGVVSTAAPTPESIAHANAATGAKVVRQFVLWSAAEPTAKGSYETSYLAAMDGAVAKATELGVKLVWTIIKTPAWANAGDQDAPPNNPADYGDFAAFVAQRYASSTAIATINIWNEPDEDLYFHGSRKVDYADPGSVTARAQEYAALVKAAGPRIKQANPKITVIVGGLTGGNVAFVNELYKIDGFRGSFDAFGVNTDFACQTTAPDSFYRETNGLIGRFSFLGYREVRAAALANGDDTPVYVTAMGWSSTGGAPNSCERGAGTGTKPSGVTEAQQAAFLRKAYECVASDPYVPFAVWFNIQDTPGVFTPDEFNHYGLLRADGSQKPAFGEFTAMVGADGGGAGAPCGDFEPPVIAVDRPAPGEMFVDRIDISARASDPGSGVARVTFEYDGGQLIRNYTADLVDGGAVGLSPWYGSSNLGLGDHVISVVALDRNGNRSRVDVPVTKVAPTSGKLKATLKPTLKWPKKVKCKRRVCTVSGALRKGKVAGPSIGGKVACQWQWRNKKGKWRKLVGGTKLARKPWTFKAKLKKGGRWRVRVVYKSVAPWKSATSKWISFKVR